MTDLERAREILARYPLETAQHVIAEAIAAARREGYEDGRTAGLEEAARCARYWTASQKIADHIRALPLTPEEP